MTQYVRTEIKNGCVVACLAMITDQSFNEVLDGMEQHWKNEGEEAGIDDPAWMTYLAARGYAIQDIDQEYYPEDRLIKNWPIKPFAPQHLCFVYDEGPHAIYMDSEGIVHDPNDTIKDSLTDYHRVYRVIGIHKVGRPIEEIFEGK